MMTNVSFYTMDTVLLLETTDNYNIPDNGDVVIIDCKLYEVAERRFNYDQNKVHVFLRKRL